MDGYHIELSFTYEKELSCVANYENDYSVMFAIDTTCPGELPDVVDEDDCNCNGELWISDDCKSHFFCRDRSVDGGISLTCYGLLKLCMI